MELKVAVLALCMLLTGSLNTLATKFSVRMPKLGSPLVVLYHQGKLALVVLLLSSTTGQSSCFMLPVASAAISPVFQLFPFDCRTTSWWDMTSRARPFNSSIQARQL